MRNSILLTALLAIAVAPAVHAQSAPVPEPIDSVGEGAIPDLPLQVMKAGNVTYISGGIGDEEKAQIMSQKHQYNFHLLLTATGGAFVSDVHLQIFTKDGTPVLDINDAGPYVYALMPAGTYMVDATSHMGNASRVKVTVPKSGAARQQITFKETDGGTTAHTPTATVD